MKKILMILLIGVGGYFGFVEYVFGNNATPLLISPQPQNPIYGIVPQHIRIHKLGVNAAVERVGLDKEKRMSVPTHAENTGWYELGYKPGENGNAVIAGHLDTKDGTPAVFWDIKKLKTGDVIDIVGENDQVLSFSVMKVEIYPFDELPIKEVFGEASYPQLNLITCGGEWDSKKRNYSERTVIYSKLQ